MSYYVSIMFTKQMNLKKQNMKYTNQRKQRIIKEIDYFHRGYYTNRNQYCHLGIYRGPRKSTHKNQVLDLMFSLFSCQNRFSKPLPARHKRLDDYSVHSQRSLHGDSLRYSTDFVTVYPSENWRLSKWEQSIFPEFSVVREFVFVFLIILKLLME